MDNLQGPYQLIRLLSLYCGQAGPGITTLVHVPEISDMFLPWETLLFTIYIRELDNGVAD